MWGGGGGVRFLVFWLEICFNILLCGSSRQNKTTFNYIQRFTNQHLLYSYERKLCTLIDG